jgi:hypothetical protein
MTQLTLIKILLDNVDEEQLLIDLMGGLVKPAIEKFVQRTPTKLDDTVVALLYTQLSELVIDEILKLVEEVKNG